MAADLQIDPDAVEDLARLVRRIAGDLPVGPGAPDAPRRAVDDLLAFAEAAEDAARRVREADLAVADLVRESRR